jgi:hypothetical protein
MSSYIVQCVPPYNNTNFYDISVEGANCPVYSGFFGVMGATAAMVFSGSCQSLFALIVELKDCAALAPIFLSLSRFSEVVSSTSDSVHAN